MPRRPLSLALRLIGLIGMASALVLIVFDWVIVHSIEAHFAELDAEKLSAHADVVAHALRERIPSTDGGTDSPALSQLLGSQHGLSLQIIARDGTVVHDSSAVDLAPLLQGTLPAPSIDPAQLYQWRDGDRSYRGAVLTLPVEQQGVFTVALATGINVHLHYMDNFYRALAITTLGAFAILLLAVWIAVHQGHAPLRRITVQIRNIRSDQLHLRLQPQTLPEELVELAHSFNQMLERLEQVFHQLSHFSADIAHELRTPVTNLMTQTQVALGESRQADEYREVLYSNLEEFERMAQMIGDMLFIAQADNGLLKLHHEPVDLAQEIHELFDFLGAWAEERELKLLLQGKALGSGDRLMLRRALSNLLSNAIRHTPAGNTVQVSLSTQPGQIEIRVENTGPAIPPEHLPRLFDRFYRVDPARQRHTEGTGLGLALVKSIVTAHRGEISVNSSEGLTCFRVVIPC